MRIGSTSSTSRPSSGATAARYLLLEEIRLDPGQLSAMRNLAAELFRIEISPTVEASLLAVASFFEWTRQAGPQQDSLRRALFSWFRQAQLPAKILGEDDASIAEMGLEEAAPMLRERLQKWEAELLAEGRNQEKRELATQLLARGMTIDEVAEICRLETEVVERLRDDDSD